VSGKADLSRPVPNVDVQARFTALDLTRFVKPAPAGSAGTPGTAGPAGTPDAADPVVDLSGLKALEGRFSVRAGSLTWPPYQVADLTLDATLAGGTLRVSQLAGRAWGGRFQMQGTAQAAASPKDQRATIKLDASDVDIAALLKDVARFERLEGRGRVSADLATRGASIGQFKQQLGGTAAFDLRDGAVRGINLAKTLRQWRAAVSQKKDTVQASSADEKTDFSEISASFQVQDGMARNRDLVAKSPFLRVGGEGSIDIGRGRIDYLAQATVTGAPEGQDGADLAALKGVTVPVELKGPLTAVDYRIQWAAVAADLLRGQAKEALDAKAGKLLDKLMGRSPASSASAPQGAASSPKDSNKDRLKKLLGL
jgi:AsmA protein